ncbi:MAG: pinensin family lanthipeptide [Bacteroidota bacterium]
MNKKKISLTKLKVKSFVTDLEHNNSDTIKGGNGFFTIFNCNTCGASCNCSNGCGGGSGTSSGGETCQNTV